MNLCGHIWRVWFDEHFADCDLSPDHKGPHTARGSGLYWDNDGNQVTRDGTKT